MDTRLGRGGGAVATFFAPDLTPLYIAGPVCWLLFFSFITWNQLRAVLRQREITSETISMSISVYLLMGLTWGLLYIVIYEIQPDAINLGSSTTAALVLPFDRKFSVFPVLVYFSFATLATIGYGDITPVTLLARYAAVAEGITGQFYLAILVARLVGMHMSRITAHHSKGETSKEPAE